jgi:N-acetylglucosamine malate deacetylase 1
MKNPYLALVKKYQKLIRAGRRIPLGAMKGPTHPALPPNAPRGLIFSPHPDDECLMGGLPLRLMREKGVRIINVAVTQGSKKARRAERWIEVKNACGYLGFELIQIKPGGLENIRTDTRETRKKLWNAAVAGVANVLQTYKPDLIFIPHRNDGNATHIGTHWLVMDALARLGNKITCRVIETEFWGAMHRPNILVELGAQHVADLMAALSFHAGEVRRNPYHLNLPAWMQDTARRGSERVGGQGRETSGFMFGALYRVREWERGHWREVFRQGRFYGLADSLKDIVK